MSDWKNVIMKLAPTVASALGGPLAGAAVTGIGSLLGLSNTTQENIAEVLTNGHLTLEQISGLKELEMKYKNDEAERGFKYAELVTKDRDSARNANAQGGTQIMLFKLSIFLLILGVGTEMLLLFHGYPTEVPDIIVGRVLGLMDAMVMMVLAYWYGTTNGSSEKNHLLSQAEPPKK